LIVACFCNFAVPRLPPMPSCYPTANWNDAVGPDRHGCRYACRANRQKRSSPAAWNGREGIGPGVSNEQMILWIEKLSEILIMEHISGELTLPLSSPGGGRLQPFIIRSPGMLAELSLCRRRSENRQSRTEDTHDRGSGRQTASLARRHGSFDSCRTALIHHRGCEGVHTSVPQ
jgi:hypothetical protein